MKIAYLLDVDRPIQASRYKYLELLKIKNDVTLYRNTHIDIRQLKIQKPDNTVIFGDNHKTYAACLKFGVPYILAEHDVMTMRNERRSTLNERVCIGNAKAIIFTSEDHRSYVCRRYRYPKEKTIVLHLRPLLKDIQFEPLPKLPGKTLVYAGGLVISSKAAGTYGYRYYVPYLSAFKKCGWDVHLYMAREKNAPNEYAAAGFICHDPVSQWELYRELSQYTAGFQGYYKQGVPIRAYGYCISCRPNKLWEYLAAGIPTIGYNTGGGGRIYDGQWGTVLRDLKKETIENITLPTITDDMRFSQVIDKDAERLQRWLENAV